MRQGPIHKRQVGFTLLETAMSLYMLLIGVLVFSGMAVFSNKVALQAKIRSAAYQVGRSQLDILKTTQFDKLMPVTDKTFDIPQEVIDALPAKKNTKYEVQGLYSVVQQSSTKKQIDIRVRWHNAASPEGQVAPWSEVRLSTITILPGSVTTLAPAGTP